jgi:hypothetical protein
MLKFWMTFAALMCALPALAQEPVQTSLYRDRDGNYQGAIGTFCVPAKDGSGCSAGGSGTNAAQTQGNTAEGAVQSGNPVRVAGSDSTNNVHTLLTGGTGALVLGGSGTSNTVLVGQGSADANSIAQVGLLTTSRGLVFNGSTWDRQRGNTEGTFTMPVPSSTVDVAITPVVGSLVNGLVAKTSAGNTYGIEIVTGASPVYVYIFNATAIPADGAVTAGTASGNYQFCMPVAANTGARFGYEVSERYSVGITMAVSSAACGTLTKVATAVFLKVRRQ